MMKKDNRGFTLIELLLTIALLAVISIISFVSINAIIDKNKNNECNTTLNNIILAAKEYVSDKRYDTTITNNTITITANTLLENNYLNGQIINPYTKQEVESTDISIKIDLNDDKTINKIEVTENGGELFGGCKTKSNGGMNGVTNPTSQGNSTYKINYNLYSGDHGTKHDSSASYDKVIEISNPTKHIEIIGNANGTGASIGPSVSANFTFAGWTSTTLGSNAKTGTLSTNLSTWTGTSTKNIYFKNLTEKNKTVTLVANWIATPVGLPTIEKEGQICKWYNSPSGGSFLGMSGDTTYTPSADCSKKITVYADCEELPTYKVYYYQGNATATGGASLFSTSTECKYGESCKLATYAELTSNAFPQSSKGWTFAGYSTASNSTNRDYTAGQTFTYNLTNDLYLYVVGQRNVNFASGIAPTSLMKTLVQYWNPYSTSNVTSITLPQPTDLSSYGFSFVGYRANNTASNTTGHSGYTVGQSFPIPPGNSVSYRSIYKRNVNVSFNANGGTGTTASLSKVQYYNSGYPSNGTNSGATITATTFTLSANGFTKSGFVFYKWAEDTTSGTRYAENTTYNFSPAVNSTNTKTMYAIWSNNIIEVAPENNENSNFLSTTIPKNQIKSVTFANSISGHTPNGTDCWDVGATKNGTVLAWTSSVTGGYNITIGGIGEVVGNANSSYLFANLTNATAITGMNNFNTSKVINMIGMFRDTDKLTTLDVSNWNTSKVTSMRQMFWNAKSLTTLDVSNWNTSSVSSMVYMFNDDYNLTTLDVSNWNTSRVTSMTQMFYNTNNLTALDVSNWNTSNVTSMMYMFYNANNLTTLDVSNWNTSNVTSMMHMFHNANNLTTLNVSNWNTSNVTSTMYMFYNANNLTTLNVSNWNTSNVTSFDSMLCYANKLRNLDVSNWNTSSATSMSSMFSWTSNLTTLDVSNWNTSNVTSMAQMFWNANNLTTLDVSNWNTSKVTNMSYLFDNLNKITTINVSNWNTSKVTNMSYIFTNATSLTTLDVSNWNTANVTNMYEAFTSVSNLTDLDVGNWNTSNVTDMRGIFNDTRNLNTLDLSSWNTMNVTDMEYMFSGTYNLRTIYAGSEWSTANVNESTNMFAGATNLVGGAGTTYSASYVDKTRAKIDGGPSNPGYFSVHVSPLEVVSGNPSSGANFLSTSIKRNQIKSISFVTSIEGHTVNNTNCWDVGATKDGTALAWATGPDANGLYDITIGSIGKVVANPDSHSLLENLINTIAINNVNNFNISNVTNMANMFTNATNLTALDVSNWNTSIVTNMYGMFYNANNLTTLDVSNWDTSNVNSMIYMFSQTRNLTTLDVSNWNTSSATSMAGMFSNANSLTTLDVSQWNTSSATSMFYMFGNASNLTTLNVSNWNTSKVINMSHMFYNLNNLTTIYVGSEWSTTNVITPVNSTQMFSGATNLVGGAGTTYNASYIDKTYARIDGGQSSPGYFTAAGAKGVNNINLLNSTNRTNSSVSLSNNYNNIDECNNNCGTSCLTSQNNYVCPTYSCDDGILSGTQCYQ